MSENFVPVLKKYDETLTEDLARDCSLSVQCSTESLCFAIFHPLLNKYLAVESVDFGKFRTFKTFREVLTTFNNDHRWLGLPYSSVVIFYESLNTTLVPSPLYLNDEKKNFADFNFKSGSGLQVFSEKIRNLDSYIIYSVHEAILDFWAGVYPNHTSFSHAGRFIDLVLLFNKNTPLQKKVFINLRKSCVDIAVPEGNKLLFFNSFEFRTREDFIYYVIFVMEQLAINPAEAELMLTGFIEKNSPMFDILNKYVKTTLFLSRSHSFKYSYHLNEIPDHYFFTVLNSRLCE
jgi:hypothetical protein